MGRLKTHKERIQKLETRLSDEAKLKLSDEEKEAQELDTLEEIRRVPGWTGDHDKDALNPGIQQIIRRRQIRQKV